MRPASAAQARMVGSSASSNPAPCTRSTSSSGQRRSSPRTTSPLKFSSFARRSMALLQSGIARAQLLPEVGPAPLRGFDPPPNRVGLLLAPAQVLPDLLLVRQVVADDGVHVCQLERVVAPDNRLGSRPVFKRAND